MVELVPPAVPLVRGSPLALRVTIKRRGGFKGAVRVKLPWKPPGVSAGEVSIAANRTEATIPLNASGSAAARSWQIAAYGFVTINGGTLRTSSSLVDLTVAKPWMTAKLGKARTEQGVDTTLVVDLQNATPFEGKAIAELIGLPRGVTAKPHEVIAESTQLSFPLEIAKNTPPGRHRPRLRLRVPSKPGDIVHIFGGAELRVDKPLSRKTAKPKKKIAKGTVASPKT